MKHKPVQIITPEQLEWGKKLSLEERIQFVEDFMKLAAYASDSKSKLISIKIPEDLLKLFRMKCESQNLTYQTQIKNLMKKWVLEE